MKQCFFNGEIFNNGSSASVFKIYIPSSMTLNVKVVTNNVREAVRKKNGITCFEVICDQFEHSKIFSIGETKRKETP